MVLLRAKIPRGLLGRRRYVLFEVLPRDNAPNRSELERSLRRTALSLYGVVGASEIELSLKSYSQRRGRGILKTDNKSISRVLCLLLATSRVLGLSGVRVLAVSGTLRGLSRREKEAGKTL